MNTQAGKGDTPRPVDGKRYRENYDAIFKRQREEDRRKQKPFKNASSAFKAIQRQISGHGDNDS